MAKEVVVPRDHFSAPRRPNGKSYIDDCFFSLHSRMYKDTEIIRFQKKYGNEVIDRISSNVYRDELPSLKTVIIPNEWADDSQWPKGVKVQYY